MKNIQSWPGRLFIFLLLALLITIAIQVSTMLMQKHTVMVRASGGMPYVHKNQIIDGFGNPLILGGAHIDSDLVAVPPYITATEILGGRHLNTATFDVMRNSWKMNAVRIGTSDYIWQANPAAYIAKLQRVVSEANQAGLYVILSLHEDKKSALPATINEGGSNMPTSEAIPYWKKVASVFKGNPMVMFDIFNEPRLFGRTGKTLKNADWQLWLNGGQLPCTGCITVVGTQTMVNTIRQAGAQQIIIVEALQNWFQTINADGTGSNFVVDPSCNCKNGNIVYSAHNYFTPNALTTADWTLKFGDISSSNNMLAMYPMFVGEWALTVNVPGLGRCSFTPAQAIAEVNSWLQFMQQYGMSWTAYSFTLKQLFLDYTNYTPTQLAIPNGSPPWTCGMATPIVGVGYIVQQYLLSNPPG